ncbi:MAG: zinc-binding dehydrogenase [Ignavibacteria bacterium]|nr:zinc-binding dehydrogenase [Ignavibacteria bacterium]
MKAVLLTEHGGTDKLHYTTDFPIPTCGPGDILVRIKATSVNRADLVVRNGYPMLTIPMPHILGGDVVGEISEIGSVVKGFSIGDRVLTLPIVSCGECYLCTTKPDQNHLCLNWKYFGMHINGSYAEYCAVPAKNVVLLPESISYEDATAFGVAGLTAYHALYTVAKLEMGETFFIWGGSGGLGTIAVQLAKAAGAIVIATVGKDDKKETIKQLGADYVFNHYTEDIPTEVKKLFPYGIDCIMDYAGTATFPKSFEMLRKGGRMLLCGILTGRETTLSIHQTYLRHLSIHGLYLGTKRELEELLTLAAAKSIKPLIGRVMDLSQAAEAHELMVSGNYLGKIVLTVA